MLLDTNGPFSKNGVVGLVKRPQNLAIVQFMLMLEGG